MCFLGGSQPVDNSAAVARQQEEARQERIRQGKSSIDSAFAAFDPGYFDQFTKSYTDFYNPQVDEQFSDAQKGLRYEFARQGILNSTPAQTRFGDLIKSYSDARGQVASGALDATNDLRNRVSSSKTTLYGQNVDAADPSLAAASAAGSVGSLMTPASFSPLADIFAGLINTGAAHAAGRQNRLPLGYANLFQPGSYATGSSGRVVR